MRTQLEKTRGEKEVEVSILEGNLTKKDKKLRFPDSSKILDNILSNQRSPSIKYSLGFHENVKGESSSQACARNHKVIKENPENRDKELRIQPIQQPNKENLRRK